MGSLCCVRRASAGVCLSVKGPFDTMLHAVHAGFGSNREAQGPPDPWDCRIKGLRAFDSMLHAVCGG
eukprot:363219-Chlamydomonas_euryale.AAC.3